MLSTYHMFLHRGNPGSLCPHWDILTSSHNQWAEVTGEQHKDLVTHLSLEHSYSWLCRALGRCCGVGEVQSSAHSAESNEDPWRGQRGDKGSSRKHRKKVWGIGSEYEMLLHTLDFQFLMAKAVEQLFMCVWRSVYLDTRLCSEMSLIIHLWVFFVVLVFNSCAFSCLCECMWVPTEARRGLWIPGNQTQVL